jgi:hypothetical protein
MSGVQQSGALKNLVVFVIALAIIGTLIALAWYFAVDLPIMQAAALNAPANSACKPYCVT